jgi:hypothetical protein
MRIFFFYHALCILFSGPASAFFGSAAQCGPSGKDTAGKD